MTTSLADRRVCKMSYILYKKQCKNDTNILTQLEVNNTNLLHQEKNNNYMREKTQEPGRRSEADEDPVFDKNHKRRGFGDF